MQLADFRSSYLTLDGGRTATLFSRQQGAPAHWKGCAIPTDDPNSSGLAILKATDNFTGFLSRHRWKHWTLECGPEVCIPDP